MGKSIGENGPKALVALLLLVPVLSRAALDANSTEKDAFQHFSIVDVNATELFVLRIDPVGMFGWKREESLGGDQFSYRPSIADYPDLPPWAQYAHDEHDAAGYIFGTPPQGHNDVMLEIVGLDRATYQVLRSKVLLKIRPKQNPAIAQVQIKVDNLDVVDLMESSRMERILQVFRRFLWPEAASDIYVTFLTSAVRLGARLPLKPDEKEGAVIFVGSSSNASKALENLQMELEPLSRSIVAVPPSPSHSSFPSLGGCPRDFRRASVDRHFREQGFHIDWCAFRLMAWQAAPLLGASPPRMAGDVGLVAGRRRRPLTRPMTLPPPSRPPTPPLHLHRPLDPALQLPEDSMAVWSRPTLSEIPERTYGREMILSVVMPLVLLLALSALLSLILCCHHEEAEDDSSVHFESLFDFCDEFWSDKAKCSPDPQMVRYEAVHRATSVLPSLSRPAEFGLTSESPHVARLCCDHDVGAAGRPLPPPYTGTNRSSHNASGKGTDHRSAEEPKTWFC